MRAKYLILISSIIILGLMVGCSTKKEQFDDNNIIFSIVNTQTDYGSKSYVIEIKNKTGYELTHLTFNLSYQIKTENKKKKKIESFHDILYSVYKYNETFKWPLYPSTDASNLYHMINHSKIVSLLFGNDISARFPHIEKELYASFQDIWKTYGAHKIISYDCLVDVERENNKYWKEFLKFEHLYELLIPELWGIVFSFFYLD